MRIKSPQLNARSVTGAPEHPRNEGTSRISFGPPKVSNEQCGMHSEQAAGGGRWTSNSAVADPKARVSVL